MEPLSGYASRVLALLVLELDLELAAKFLPRAGHEMLETALEDVLSLEADVDGLVLGPASQSLELSFEQRVLVVEGEQVGCGC